MNPLYASALLALGLVLSNVVHAHIGVHANGSFETGVMHPFSGLDHMLAMIAVGLWAAQSGGRSLVAMPAAFVIAMALGAWLGIAGGYLPLAEQAIAVSVVMFGFLVAFSMRGSWQWVAPLVFLLALFHGYAHGAGMPESMNSGSYVAGILLATLVLHASGVTAAAILRSAMAVRAGGGMIALCGMWIALSA